MVMSLCCLWRKFWRWRSLHSFASVPRPLTLYGLWNLIAGRVLGSFRNRPSPFAITLLSLHGFLLGLLSRVFLDNGPYLLGVFFLIFFIRVGFPKPRTTFIISITACSYLYLCKTQCVWSQQLVGLHVTNCNAKSWKVGPCTWLHGRTRLHGTRWLWTLHGYTLHNNNFLKVQLLAWLHAWELFVVEKGGKYICRSDVDWCCFLASDFCPYPFSFWVSHLRVRKLLRGACGYDLKITILS